MAHLLQHKCYIHCVFLLKKTENSNARCRSLFFCLFVSFLMCIDNTFSFDTRTNCLSINNERLENKMEVKVLGIWSSYEAF